MFPDDQLNFEIAISALQNRTDYDLEEFYSQYIEREEGI